MKVLVTGANGLVGTHYLNYTGSVFEFLTPNEHELDITVPEKIDSYLKAAKPECLLNLAAYTDTQKAQTQKELAWNINVKGTANLADKCEKYKIFLVQVSTDLIFDGKNSPEQFYYEDDSYPTDSDSICWYGATKLKAEETLLRSSCKHAIVRIAYPFAGSAHKKKDILHNIIDLYDSDNLYPIFSDNTITPTYINDFSKAVNRILDTQSTGIFHVVSHNPTSHYEFAKYTLEKTGRDINKLKQGSLKEFSKRSGIPRPLYINLDTGYTEKKLKLEFGTWQENVDKALKQLSL